ncbi:hypothetical protein TNIN_478031, partial [Trichonephila inaurata madagascariensis]
PSYEYVILKIAFGLWRLITQC